MKNKIKENVFDVNDDLTDFLIWSLNNISIVGMVPFETPVWTIENVTSTLMYRKTPYQIQMFSVPGNTIIPEHTHPNVDSYEVYLGGNINFSHSGKYVILSEELRSEIDSNLALPRGRVIRVLPNEKHGGVFGPEGGVFLSVQKWLNNVTPHCVAADYTGVVMGSDHLKKVKCGNPVLKNNLTEDDVVKTQNNLI